MIDLGRGAPIALPGTASVPAVILRSPRSGGQYIQVLALTLKVAGVLFQPEHLAPIFAQSGGGAVYKRYFCYANWPAGVQDPFPVHPGDRLSVSLKTPVTGQIQSSPAPSKTQFGFTPGQAERLVLSQDIGVGTQTTKVFSVSGDVVTVDPPLPAAPSPGTAAGQTALSYVIDDADCYYNHHIKIYVRLDAHNAPG